MTDPAGSVMKKWLTEDEASDYQWTIHIMDEYMGPRKVRLTELEAERLSIARRMSRYFERLAACRATIKKHQYQYFYSREDESEGNYCIGCGMIEGLDCKPDCAIAKALKGVGGE